MKNVLRIFVTLGVICFLCLTFEAARAGQPEERAKLLKEYEAADLNKDGYLDENEYKSYISKKFASMHGKEDKRIEKKDTGKREGMEFVTRGKERDQKISFKEFLNGRLRFYNEADANKDSLLSFEEYVRMKMIDPVK